jgi:3-deoxy-7-phosphoheptulonate synthase
VARSVTLPRGGEIAKMNYGVCVFLNREFQHVQTEWSPDSWQRKPIAQPITYPDPAALQGVLAKLRTLPPLVTSWEIETLRQHLAEAARGERFLLQGGDCSESFEECQAATIAQKLKILLQMMVILTYGCKKRVALVGRYAGQYAKPRSSLFETRDGLTLPSYRGDTINRMPFTEPDRTPDPELLLRGYHHSALTLNFIRSLVQGGFADLHHTEYWDLGFVHHSSHAEEYHAMVERIADAIRFMETCATVPAGDLNRVEFYTSHEGLNLWYEQALTQRVPRRSGWYNLGTHFPWIGDRTRALDHAHVEYFRGICNPIAVKVGTSVDAAELLALAEVLNPHNTPGRLTFIHRMGADRIAERLPPLLTAITRAGKQVLWTCDPMHGNTLVTKDGVKTRRFDDILRELELAFQIHQDAGTILGGVHFEMTGEDVTECLGGARGLAEGDLARAYKSNVDPRLNYDQAMEIAFRVARCMRANGTRPGTARHPAPPG